MDASQLMTLFMSSNSSEDCSSEDEHVIKVILPEVLQHHQKNELYAEHIVPLYTDKEFVEHFKVPRQLLKQLAREFEGSDYFLKKDTGFRRVDAGKCMWVFSWYATHEAASYRDMSDRFNIAISTLNIIIENVIHFLSYKSNECITWPTIMEKNEILEEFRQMGFPDVLGCLDGTHVRIDKPTTDSDSFLNRKKYYSIQVQAVCDSKRRIRDIFIGFPGSVHDTRVFNNSPLFESLHAKCQDKIILADTAYPCLRNLLTPYRDNGNLSPTESNFNSKLSHCRILIEHTFGLLKQKYRQLYHLKLRSQSLICHFIRTCCVLHNLTLDTNILEDDVDELVAMEDNNDVGENEPLHELEENVEVMLTEIM